MNQIRCPKCGEVFTIDEADYASIVEQIKNGEYKRDLARLEKEYDEKIVSAVKLAESESKSSFVDEINKKEQEIVKLKAELEKKDVDNKLALTKAVSDKDREISELQAEKRASEDNYNEKIKAKDELIAYYKDFKAKQSTKMVGEDLEQHCSYEFNKIRPLFPNAYFEKDNEVSKTTGSKGDFIFRDYDDDGNEIVSIMFEMKNEMDTTASKHKNEDFFKELDKDRIEKKCEYAVLVSLLEMDNDYYNDGIVDLSHKFKKMYAIRPQFFIPIITLLRNAALKSLDYKKELALIKNQDIDVTNFENNMNTFKESFAKNYNMASKKFEDAIAEIDKSIDHLQKIKAALTGSENNLRIANNKAQELTIKKLTKNAPSVLEKFKALESE